MVGSILVDLGKKTELEFCGALLVLIVLVRTNWHLTVCAQFIMGHLSWAVRSRAHV
jgi:hypothetical protein